MHAADTKTSIAIAVVELDGCFLVGRRPEGALLAGLWEFPGGKVEPGETPRHAAARECREEAGLEVDVGAAYPTVEHEYGHGGVRLHFFACSPRDPAGEPKPPFVWVPAARLAELSFPVANARLIKELVEKRAATD
jgi:mutator protein MutT